jgi:hypothetical protein
MSNTIYQSFLHFIPAIAIVFFFIVFALLTTYVFAYFEGKKLNKYYAPILLIIISAISYIAVSLKIAFTGILNYNILAFSGLGCMITGGFLKPTFSLLSFLIILPMIIIYYIFLMRINLQQPLKCTSLWEKIKSKKKIILIHLVFLIIGIALGFGACT